MIEKKLIKTITKKIAVLLLMAGMQFQNYTYGQEPRLDSLRNELHSVTPSIKSSLKDSTYVNILNALAYEIRYLHSDSLRLLSEEALQLSQNIGYVKGGVQAYINLGKYQSDGGYHEKGIELISKALEKARSHKLYDLELWAISSLAIQHDYLDKNDLAFIGLLDGIDIATKRNNEKYLSIFNLNAGVLYLSLHEYDEAISYLKNSKNFGERYGDELLLAAINSNLASAYNHIDQPETGMQVIEGALTTYEKFNDTDWLAFAYTIKGKAYLQKEDYTSALVWFKKSEELYNTVVNDKRSEVILLVGMAKTYLNLEKYSIAEGLAKRALEQGEIFDDKDRMKNASELLYNLYKKKGDLVASFKYLEIFQHLSETLAQNKGKERMLLFKTKLDYEKQKQVLIENNEKALINRTYIIVSILTLLLFLTGYILTLIRNHKIEKKLNQELKKREIELLEINETKDKLFSIISHDLRGPINAFSKLIVLFNNGDIEKEQFISFMPKLESDVKYISFSLNNLLSWGSTQMEGAITKPVHVDLADVFTANINLLSEIARNKSIKINSTLDQHSMVWSDADHADVIVRNLLSNALKFTPKDGLVTITALENDQNWEVSIKDTGVGMDRITQNKIFDKKSNISSYGTENEKGTGLGLTLCKELIDNNKGTIMVDSILNKGTSFTFTLPKAPNEGSSKKA